MLYDLLVIGDEREGVARAVDAARMGRRVAVISQPESSTPSLNLLFQAVENLAGNWRVTNQDQSPSLSRRGGVVPALREKSPTMAMTTWRAEVARLIRRQMTADNSLMDSLAIDRISGNARFVSETSVRIIDGSIEVDVSGTEIIIACGTKSRQPASFQADGERILVVESLLELTSIPRSTIVIGAGETGFVAANLLARLGSEVTVIDDHVSLFEICRMFGDSYNVIQELQVAFRLGEEAIGVEQRSGNQAIVRLASGRELMAEVVLACVGREGKTEGLNLDAAGVGLDERSRIWCDMSGKTWSSRIIAVGSVVGFSGHTEPLSV
jgi:NAD(P) transhydrogenase